MNPTDGGPTEDSYRVNLDQPKKIRLQYALDAAKSGISLNKASKMWKVSLTTLYNHFKKPEKDFKHSTRVLNTDEEQKLVAWIEVCASRGCPRSRQNILEQALNLMKHRVDSNCTIPSTTWLKLFLKRNNLVARIPQCLSYASCCVNKENLLGWFGEVEENFKKDSIFEVLSNPSLIFNCDESFFQFDPPSRKVIAVRGSKDVFESQTNGKEGITVLLTVAADGTKCFPYIVFPYERVPPAIRDSFPSDKANYTNTKSGWMQSDAFCLYLRCLAEENKQKGVKMPEEKIILFLDNHSSHVGLEAMQLAQKLGIYVVALYPNSTFILQPADVGCFGPLKSIWRGIVKQKKMLQPGLKVTNLNFTGIFLEALEQLKETAIKNAFRVCGLNPWNPNAVQYDKCLGKKNVSTEDVSYNSCESTESCSFTDITELPSTLIGSKYSNCEYSISAVEEAPAVQTSFDDVPLEPGFNDNVSTDYYLTDENLKNAVNGTLPEKLVKVMLKELALQELKHKNHPTVTQFLPQSPEDPIGNEAADDSAITEEIVDVDCNLKSSTAEILPLPLQLARKNKRLIKRKPYTLSSPDSVVQMVDESLKKRKIAEDKENAKMLRLEKRRKKIEDEQQKLEIDLAKAGVDSVGPFFKHIAQPSKLNTFPHQKNQENWLQPTTIQPVSLTHHHFVSNMIERTKRIPFTPLTITTVSTELPIEAHGKSKKTRGKISVKAAKTKSLRSTFANFKSP